MLGSAGGPRHALPLLTDPNREPRTANRDPFLIINGDTLTNVAIDAVLVRHRESGARVTMALIPNPRPDKYGGVLVSDDGYVTGFTRAGSDRESFHFIGVQVADAAVFAALQDGVPVESVNHLYPRLIRETARSVAAFVGNASFRDIGTPADYLETSIQLTELEGDHLVSTRGTRIDRTARLTRSAVWDDVTIGAGAELTECIVGDGVTIAAGAVYRRTAIVRQPAGSGDDVILHPID